MEIWNHEAAGGPPDDVVRFADMFSAMGTEARLRIMRLLLSAHPDGMVVGEIADELDIPASTLSHHLDKLKNERPGAGAARGHVPPVYRQHRRPAGAARLPVCGVLHAQQGRRTRQDSLLPIGERHADVKQARTGEIRRGRAASGTGGSACCGASPARDGCCDPITSNLYDAAQVGSDPGRGGTGVAGCGNPTALAELHAGETVLDLGSGGGIDVLLSARRVGPTARPTAST